MNLSPQPHEGRPRQGAGRIRVGKDDLGAGVAISSDVVFTAAHVLSRRQPGVPVIFEPRDGQPVPAVSSIQFAEGLDAAALHLVRGVAFPPWADPKPNERWMVPPTGRANDPQLTGTISSTGIALPDSMKKNRVMAVQLEVDQNIGDFRGYSGSGVFNADGKIIGILFEQLLQRFSTVEKRASNVLYALHIADVSEKLGYELQTQEPRQLKTAVAAAGEQAPRGNKLLRRGLAGLIDRSVDDYERAWNGRKDVMDQLDRFMLNSEDSYCVVAAPAGFGKTGLAAALVKREPPGLAYHFFTKWFTDGLDELFFLQNVVEQLAWLRGRQEDIPESPGRLRGMYYDLLSEPVDRKLILLLDGLDDVSAWRLDQYMVHNLPDKVKLIVTVRDGQDWAAKYRIPVKNTTVLKVENPGAVAPTNSFTLLWQPTTAPKIDDSSRPAPAKDFVSDYLRQAAQPRDESAKDSSQPSAMIGGANQLNGASLQAGQALNRGLDELQAQVMQTELAAAAEQAQYQELQIESDPNNSAASSIAQAAQHKMQTNSKIFEGFDQVISGE